MSEPPQLPPLSDGTWFSGSWRGAVLTGKLDATVGRFLDEAIGAFRNPA